MAIKKGVKMIEELVRRRANGEGLKTIARSLNISKNTVKNRLKDVGAYDVKEASKLACSDTFIIKQDSFTPHWSGLIDWQRAISEIETGVGIKEFWEENLAASMSQDLQNIPYETFWREFRRRHPNISIHYHKNHEPGMRTEIDYKGDGDTDGLGFVDLTTGEFVACRLFGQVLCSSRLFFPYATINEKRPSWLSGVAEGFKYFGGATQYLVVDNTRCAINSADWFDPDINQEFFNFCNHYGVAILAARPRRPKDKNLIEVHLGVFWRWIRRKLRQSQFFSLGELNRYLKEMADIFNGHYQKKYGSSRIERFNNFERSTLRPLPLTTYELGEWKKAILHEDSHIQHKYNFYSAPFYLRGKDLDVRITMTHVEIFYQRERVALHQKRPEHQRGNYSTEKSHLPKKLQAMEEVSVNRLLSDAKKIGIFVEKIISNLLLETNHPLMFLRRSMGILRLKGKCGAEKLDRACELLIRHGRCRPSVKEVERMTKGPNLDNRPILLSTVERKSNPHLRGQMSFTSEGENKYE